MTTLWVVYCITVFVWFAVGTVGIYSRWSDGVSQKTAHIFGFMMLGIVPIANTLLLLMFFFEELLGSELEGRKQ